MEVKLTFFILKQFLAFVLLNSFWLNFFLLSFWRYISVSLALYFEMEMVKDVRKQRERKKKEKSFARQTWISSKKYLPFFLWWLQTFLFLLFLWAWGDLKLAFCWQGVSYITLKDLQYILSQQQQTDISAKLLPNWTSATK